MGPNVDSTLYRSELFRLIPKRKPKMVALVQAEVKNTMLRTVELNPKSSFPMAAENEDRHSIGSDIFITTTHERK